MDANRCIYMCMYVYVCIYIYVYMRMYATQHATRARMYVVVCVQRCLSEQVVLVGRTPGLKLSWVSLMKERRLFSRNVSERLAEECVGLGGG